MAGYSVYFHSHCSLIIRKQAFEGEGARAYTLLQYVYHRKLIFGNTFIRHKKPSEWTLAAKRINNSVFDLHHLYLFRWYDKMVTMKGLAWEQGIWGWISANWISKFRDWYLSVLFMGDQLLKYFSIFVYRFEFRWWNNYVLPLRNIR